VAMKWLQEQKEYVGKKNFVVIVIEGKNCRIITVSRMFLRFPKA
jgi:hypothetical protein